MNNDIPLLSADLIEQLDKNYPNLILSRSNFDISLQQIWFQAGQRSVVEDLKGRLRVTLENQESIQL